MNSHYKAAADMKARAVEMRETADQMRESLAAKKAVRVARGKQRKTSKPQSEQPRPAEPRQTR